MIEIKVYLYDRGNEFVGLGGYRGTDLSKYVAQGFGDKEDITQELDASDLTLYGYPQQKEFDPETKFIIDIVEDDEIVKTLHRIVQKDLVNQPELVDDGYYDHHITLIEPSAIAQKRMVDNIAATFKLKSVTLEELVAYPQDENVVMINSSSAYTPSKNFGYSSSTGFFKTNYSWTWGKYFQYEGNIELLDENDNVITRKYVDTALLQGQNGIKAKWRVPKLAIYGGIKNTKTFAKLGYASIDYLIEEISMADGSITNSWDGSFISNSNLGTVSNYYIPYSYSDIYKSEWLLEDDPYEKVLGSYVWVDKPQIRKYTQTSENDPTYITPEYTIRADRQYRVTISLHTFTDSVPYLPRNDCKVYTGAPNLYVSNTHKETLFEEYGNGKSTYKKSNSQQTQMSTIYVTYDIDTKKLVFSNSTPYSALALLQKAVMNCTLYEKTDGVYIGDINNGDIPFYVDPNFIDELSETRVIENFYNQKNLWEVLIEVGNYIHAVPEIVFGDNDRLMITFNRLGITDQSENASQKITIMNSKGMEDYVSACSSYITNMVQLGGTIEEWVAPKTTDETYLVSNDTAEIVVSKPIIELLEIKVRCDVADGSGITAGSEADITPFVYEENIYKTLSLDKLIDPNRGIAMYFTLGDNKITGGNYQLPQANPNAYTQYAIKKIIWSAFFYYPTWADVPPTFSWDNVVVNNYSFFVKYRTKDSVRQNHTRPDLRKYLLTNSFDKVPQHNQFNNQQDVVIDSIKFGNNMYGKLIRTGNTNYTMTEWSNSYNEIKHKGELYNINGELYYVARANHIFYATHIISEIEYSKDYNQLSPIIGIPSEPRFYEISEQSLIWREIAIDDYLLVTDDKADQYGQDWMEKIDTDATYIRDCTHLKNLLFTDGTTFSKYAITTFKGDKDVSEYDQTIGQPNFYIDVLSPINAYSSENTLTYEWDMLDNFSAGDKIVETDKDAYKSLRAVQYTDIYGKAALFDFYILGDIPQLTKNQVQALPESPIATNQPEETNFIGNYEVLAGNVKEPDENYNGRGLSLLKDCREALSINYNLQAITTSDTFILSPFFYLPNKENVRIVFLTKEVNKLTNGYIDISTIADIKDENGQSLNPYQSVRFSALGGTDGWGRSVLKAFSIDLSDFEELLNDGHFTDSPDFQRIKAIAVVCNVPLDASSESSQASIIPTKTQFVMARNIPNDWTKAQALSSWWFGAPNTYSIFKNRQ